MRLYSRKVSAETTMPLSRLNGTTAKSTSVLTLFIAPFTAVPMPTIVSSGRPNSSENFGSR